MLKKVTSICLALALALCVDLPVKASVTSSKMKSKTIGQTVKVIKNVQFNKLLRKKANPAKRKYSLLAQPFYVTEYSDALNTNIYSRNQAGTISQENFPLIISTYQVGQGDIDGVKIDGTDIEQVHSESDFYSIGENKVVFFMAEKDSGKDLSDPYSSSWYSYIAISTLSKGAHTIQISCNVDGTELYDSITVIVS